MVYRHIPVHFEHWSHIYVFYFFSVVSHIKITENEPFLCRTVIIYGKIIFANRTESKHS
jgi:hypothetical protein